jgi:CRISPR-associated protein Cas2
VLVIVAYDISEDGRRTAVSELLLDHGSRINFSVFRCRLSANELKDLERRIESLIDPGCDRVEVFLQCQACAPRHVHLGAPAPDSAEGGDILIV